VTRSLKPRARRIAQRLAEHYPDATCALHFQNPVQLLVATILSAQCTDERVNMVTPELFARCPTAAELAAVSQDELERIIQSTGFFRNKAQNIRGCCRQLVDRFGGQVPRELEDLVQLPGVGRKTANVVLGTAYGIPSGVVVDTHVARVSTRLGLTPHSDPVKIEQDLMKILPQNQWIDYSHRIIHHGRTICKARRPLCANCFLLRLCPQVGVAPAADQGV
jgi:endonuclease-3